MDLKLIALNSHHIGIYINTNIMRITLYKHRMVNSYFLEYMLRAKNDCKYHNLTAEIKKWLQVS